MKIKRWLTKCLDIILEKFLGIIVLLVLSFFGIREYNKQPINISGTNGPTQLAVASPGANQVINQRKTINSKVDISKSKQGDLYVTQLVFKVSDGYWDSSEKFKLSVKMSGPHEEVYFSQGFPSLTSDGIISSNESGFSFETSTPPNNEAIVLVITSKENISVLEINVSPTSKSNP